MACSQPAPARRAETPPARAGADDVPSFSQPAAGADELLLGTQFQNTQPGAASSQVSRSGGERGIEWGGCRGADRPGQVAVKET